MTDTPPSTVPVTAVGKSVRSQVPAFSLNIKRKRRIINSVRLKGDFKITSVYRPRTTLADRFPMNLVVEYDGNTAILAEEVENVGKGSLVVEVEDDGSCNLRREGNIQYSVGKKKNKTEFFSEDSPIIIGSFEVTISRD